MDKMYNDYIRSLIEEYDIIIILVDVDCLKDISLNSDSLFIAIGQCEKKVIVLSTSCILQSYSIDFIELNRGQMISLLTRYYEYEFTDQIRVVSKSSQYGSMLNYLSTGIMTEEEYFEALLH